MTGTGEKHAPPWLWPNLLGLDAPVVAVSWQLLFAKTFDTDFPVVLHVILGLSVWCIYLADRLYDATRTGEPTQGTDRLIFTKRHFKPLAAALAVASVSNLILIIRHVPGNLIIYGLATAFLLVVYYGIRLKGGARLTTLIPREILCGMLFSIGCAITPLAYAAPGTSGLQFWIAVICFGLVCSASCILISIWEREEDLSAGDRSIATISPRITRHISTAIILIGVFSLVQLNSAPWRIHLAVALAAFAQLLALRFDNRIQKPILRVLGDAVLLSPVVLLWG
jgi:hypothetical protein